MDLKGSKNTRIGKLVISKTYKQLIFGKHSETRPPAQVLVLDEWIHFGDMTIRARTGKAKPGKDNILLPTDFSGNLRVRTWRAGDKIEASFGTKKIQDVFVDAKIDADLRKKWPIVTHRNTIVWVPRLIAGKSAGTYKNNLIIEVK